MENGVEYYQPGNHARRTFESFAFLNHSSATLPNNLPPSVDDKPLARQKRRRTSPEDQTILETAYIRDPKPDKAARLELVKRVALGEKEVQIWFQNRRQTSRRKSRPLLPHEIAQYQMSRQESIHDISNESEDLRLPDPVLPDTGIQYQQDTALPHVPDHRLFSSSTSAASQDSNLAESLPSSSFASSHPRSFNNEALPPLGYLANRRSAPSLREIGSIVGRTNPHHHLKGSISSVRLSLSHEGNAKIVTKDSASPSPPRPAPSQVLIDQEGQFPHSAETHSTQTLTRPPRISSGRSRDSRAWEFWCDKDVRGELEDKAEKDASGSAADAIGLLRSTSGRRVLGPLPAKRNSTLFRHSSLKRSKLEARPALLQKSRTSLGRLQSKTSNEAALKSIPNFKHSESAIYIPGNDSDKENWSPEGLHHSKRTEEVELYHSNPAKHGTRVPIETPSDSSSNDENNDPEADPELAAFMRGGEEHSPAEEEMDCVQGLLSLREGNWR